MCALLFGHPVGKDDRHVRSTNRCVQTVLASYDFLMYLNTPFCLQHEAYHPMIDLQCWTKAVLGNGLVSMSAICFSVCVALMMISWHSTCSRKWWIDWLMCLVRGRILGRRASSSAPLLSSKTVQWIFGGRYWTCSPSSRASLRMPIKRMTSLRLVERAMYSASVVDNAVIVCILEARVMGAPAKRTIQADQDLDIIGSIWALEWRQFPA